MSGRKYYSCHHHNIILLGAVRGKTRKTVDCPLTIQDKDMAHTQMSLRYKASK